jgi:hypothetical protein
LRRQKFEDSSLSPEKNPENVFEQTLKINLKHSRRMREVFAIRESFGGEKVHF